LDPAASLDSVRKTNPIAPETKNDTALHKMQGSVARKLQGVEVYGQPALLVKAVVAVTETGVPPLDLVLVT
jgi:hypothetical protein